MLALDRESAEPLYEQIYRYIKEAIEGGHFVAGTRLPSVRALAAENGVSKITVEQAYVQLAAEGYIRAHNRSPYEVLDLPYYEEVTSTLLPTEKGKRVGAEEDNHVSVQAMERMKPVVYYNFATGAMDPEGFDYTRWKRYIGYVLREPERLMGYGDSQGESVLRENLATYLQGARGVQSTADRIIIGSGTQSSVAVTASLLRRRGLRRIAVDSSLYNVIIGVFEDCGFSVITVSQDSEDLVQRLVDERIEVFYCTPSHGDSRGRVMSVARRKELLRWASLSKAYIIEDDYDSELRYYGRPMASLQGLDKEERVIYIGTPSKVLPPSIRLSYMVLPQDLMDDFIKGKERYRQSAGVMEQLVWARYIEAGEWSKQIRRLRKHYAEKSRYMAKLLMTYLGDSIIVTAPEGGVYIGVTVHTVLPKSLVTQRALAAGLAVKEDRTVDGVSYLLSFSAIPTQQLEKAVMRLAAAWKGI